MVVIFSVNTLYTKHSISFYMINKPNNCIRRNVSKHTIADCKLLADTAKNMRTTVHIIITN